jgi:hypothetical protein
MPEGQQRAKRAPARDSRAHPAPTKRNDPKPSAAKSGEAVPESAVPESAAAEGAERPSPDPAELQQLRARLVAARSDIQYRGRR